MAVAAAHLSDREYLVGKRVTSTARWGLIFHHNTGINQNGEVVLDFEGSVFWERRN